MSEPTQQQKCADLARKMGWKLEQDGYWQQWRSADGKTFCSVRPSCDESPIGNPYESVTDKDALLAWLAADDARWAQFEAIIRPLFAGSWRRLLSAPREIIADAAWLAIQEKNNG